jgi:hypothetical protein
MYIILYYLNFFKDVPIPTLCTPLSTPSLNLDYK